MWKKDNLTILVPQVIDSTITLNFIIHIKISHYLDSFDLILNHEPPQSLKLNSD
jgi:hypothetical protein